MDALASSPTANAPQHPTAYDLFGLLRSLQMANPQLPRLGYAARRREEPVRVGQDPELDFAPATVVDVRMQAAAGPSTGVSGLVEVRQRAFGLFGPNGPLPLHLTEQARQRARSHADRSFAAFVDLLQHRSALFLFRAWSSSRPEVHADRPDDDAYARWLGSLAGLGGPAFADRDALPDTTKRGLIPWLARRGRPAGALVAAVSAAAGTSARLEPFVGHWTALPPGSQSRLGGAVTCESALPLGGGAAIGRRMWDRTSRVRLHLAPVSRKVYESLLPGEDLQRAVRDAVRLTVGLTVDVELRPWLRAEDVPPLTLGGKSSGSPARLGRSAWLLRKSSPVDRPGPAVRFDRLGKADPWGDVPTSA